MIANWIVLVLLTVGVVATIGRGLDGEDRTVSYSAVDVLVGCGMLVLIGFAAWGLWSVPSC